MPLVWRARWDLNPRYPAPQADVLIRTRLRAPDARLLYSQYLNANIEGKIINTLLKLKNNGLEEQTAKSARFAALMKIQNGDFPLYYITPEFRCFEKCSQSFTESHERDWKEKQTCCGEENRN
jgi:hypothetical protein